MKRQNNKIIFIILLSAICFLTYSSSLNNGFVWLDHPHMEDKAVILDSWQKIKLAFTSPFISIKAKDSYYRPLFKLSLSLDYWLWGLNPFGYHLSSVVLHLLTNILFFLICLYLRLPAWLSFSISAVNIVAPLHVSNVAWISARADLLAGFFVLLSLYLYLLKNKLCYYSSLFAFLFALLSKEIAIVFPFFLLIAEYLKTKRYKRLIAYFALSIIYLLVRLVTLGKLGTRVPLLWGAPYISFLSSLAGFGYYILKMFFPFKLSVSDAFPKYHSLLEPAVAISLLLFLSLLFILVRKLRRGEVMAPLSLFWLFLFYLPISNIVPALHFWAERFFYLPAFGLLLFLANFIKKPNPIIISILILIIIFYASLTFNYSHKFRNDETLFYHTLKVSPYSIEAHSALGYYYMKRGLYPYALYHYILALNRNRSYYQYYSGDEAYNNIAVSLMRLGRFREAEYWLRQGLRFYPKDKLLRLNLNILLAKLKKQENENKH